MTDFSKVTTEEFNRILAELIEHEPAGSLLSIPGVYEPLAEYFNNAVLERWEDEQQDLKG